MPDRPLLTFPEPGEFERHDLSSGPGPDLNHSDRDQHQDHVEDRLTKLEEALEKRRIELQDSPAGVEPEKVLVLETVDRVDFLTAIRNSDGFEWLLEWDDEFQQEDEGFQYEDSEKALRGRVFLVFSNQQGLEQLKSLWERYKSYKENPQDVDFPYGKTQWRDVFENLRDIRPWGPVDRLKETGLADAWRKRVEAGHERIKIEIELWFRRDAARREGASTEVRRLVQESGGEVVNESLIPAIDYHALLGELPITEVEDLIDLEGSRLIRCDEVMLFRPSGQASVRIPPEDGLEEFASPPVPEHEGEPLAALLDGVPQQNHPSLQGRLIVDDPEGWEETTQVQERRHGTAMASLAIWGNMDNPDEPLDRPLYVRPILHPDPHDWEDPARERVPEERLPVQLVYEAVRRLYEAPEEEQSGGVAPKVRAIGLAVGDPNRPFARTVSAWARLLDHLSYKYNVLFVVSAGNQNGSLTYSVSSEEAEGFLEDDGQLARQTVQALLKRVRHRRVISPAESINALTVGAAHRDYADSDWSGRWIDPLPSTRDMVSPISSVGFGHRRSLKPDILFDGGRQLYRRSVGSGHDGFELSPVVSTTRPPGIRAAYPSDETGNELAYFCGTSPAAAQTVGVAARLMEQLSAFDTGPVDRDIDNRYLPALTKALMVHAANWGEAEALISDVRSDGSWREQKRACERLLGYGALNPSEVFGCTEQRATLLGWGTLNPESAHRYSLPLPEGLRGSRVPRRVRYTLAWLSPINCSHQKYRRIHLYLSRYGDDVDEGEDPPVEEYLDVSRQQVQYHSSRRGTVQHNIFDGNGSALFPEGGAVDLQVNCREDAGHTDHGVTYGLVASLEVPEEQDIPIYEQIRAAIRARVGVEAR